MGKGRIEVFRKADKEHLKLLNKFLIENRIKELNMEDILDVNDNDLNETNNYVFYIDDDEIKDIYYINVVKDLKMCTITLPTNNIKSKKALSSTTNYILKNTNMKQVFVKLSKENETLKEYLLEQGYEDLGEEDNHLLLLKDSKEKTIEESSRKNNRR